ncbi:isochorismatase family protein [Aliiglaciecola sp. 3_MG-2023]|uniref:isochorismatase family protein n=1 Tax=Aliiglaciecola sp. 3_MG-2023 TaxID=3062644 RepID=UPI0026E21B40|nr:isochorismatase family protein [Aliiglaciecola sp. 3_MG-2023]MDO6693790.1 isochorismatase family protein [Aliiglaciecola sp. 3_MG-2023]
MKSKIASINVDPQKGFTPICPDELPVEEGDQIVPELLAQNALADFIIGSSDAHCEQALFRVERDEDQFQSLDYANTDCTFKMHCRPGTKGFELLDGLPSATEYDFFVWKGVAPDLHPYGACYHDLAEKLSTGIIEYLVFNNVDTVIVGGLATDYCVATTAIQLQDSKRFNVVLNLGACRGITPEGVKQQLALMEAKGITILQNSHAVETWLGKEGAS